MSVLDKLTEGIVNRDLQKEGSALLGKWEKTGLLEGLDNENSKSTMARLLENQAKELLREASTMAGGDVEGFASVAFPIVRRVFGSLIANDLVSVQPMSLPSGLIFFLDFTVSKDNNTGSNALPRVGYGHQDNDDGTPVEESLFGGGRVGSALTGGVRLSGSFADKGPYGLNTGYASPTGSATISTAATVVARGTFMGQAPENVMAVGGMTQAQFDNILCQGDPDLISGSSNVVIYAITHADLKATANSSFNKNALAGITLTTVTDEAATKNFIGGGAGSSAVKHSDFDGITQARRLTMYSGSNITSMNDVSSDRLLVHMVNYDGSVTATAIQTAIDDNSTANQDTTGGLKFAFPIVDNYAASNAVGSVVGATEFGLENTKDIPEIDIKVDSIAVTAMTKKLKAKWTPELGQDLNAYHNLDAEVELTSILSEQIALEIDREILSDLVKGGTADHLYWSRRPGNFIDRRTGRPIGDGFSNESLLGADFTGTVSEWYETLVETINDVSAQIHRKTLRGGANFIVTSPEVANILEFTAGFRANVTHDSDKGTVGAVNVGSLSKKWDVYVDPYFLRNVVLVGRKGGSFLESGYVYAPYVPLQVTPTIFGTEDFVPRKGVMTRYAKKMVRPDMYGVVVCTDMNG